MTTTPKLRPPPTAAAALLPGAEPDLYDDGLFYPDTDGEPLPDGEFQAPLYTEILSTLTAHFRHQPRTRVNGNTFIYYERGNPRRFVSPDCYVAFDVDVEVILHHNTYRIWAVGKAPDFILEIGSPSTATDDLGPKRRLYARIGARESWRYDKTGGDHYGFPLEGDDIGPDGEITPIEIHHEPDGMVWGHSRVLGLDLCWDRGRLRFYDPVAGQWLRNYEETQDELTAAESRADAAEQQLSTERDIRATAESRADAAETFAADAASRADVAETRANTAESRLATERAARDAAETRAAQLESELRRLRGDTP